MALTPEQALAMLQAQNRHLAQLLTSLILKHGKYDITSADPGFEVTLSLEELQNAAGAWSLEQHPQPDKGVILKLVKPPAVKQ